MRPAILVYDSISGTTSGLKDRLNLKMAAILKISKFSLYVYFDIRYEKTVTNCPRKNILYVDDVIDDVTGDRQSRFSIFIVFFECAQVDIWEAITQWKIRACEWKPQHSIPSRSSTWYITFTSPKLCKMQIILASTQSPIGFSLLAKITFWQVCSFNGLSVCLSVLDAITQKRFEVSSPNLVQICILVRHRSL